MCPCKDKKELVAISGDLEGSKFICCGADDNAGHLYTQTGWQSLQDRRAEERKGGEMEHGKRGDERGTSKPLSH